MRYLIRTLYQHTYATKMWQAEDVAKDYITDMVKAGLPSERIWARIIDMNTNMFRLVTVGKGCIYNVSDEDKGVVYTINYSNYLQQ